VSLDQSRPAPARDPLQRLERLLGRVLVTGVVLSASILAAGIVFTLTGWPAAPVLLRIGLIVLMATPILRVVVSVAEYVRLRDWFFSATALAVLLVLLTSVTLALMR
jgi:uncharacterized membrane protein